MTPEHAFQAWADRLIDRIVLPPMFVSGIDHAASDMGRIERRSALQARGIKFGLPDLFVCQAPRTITWVELKRGSAVTPVQEVVHRAMEHTGQHVWVCRSMAQIVVALRNAGFKLHANADELARQYQERLDARETAPRTPKAPRKARARATLSQITRVEAARKRMLTP